MKRYLLFIISMLCVSIGAWAVATVDTSTDGKFVLTTNDDPELITPPVIDGYFFNQGKTVFEVKGTINQTGLNNLMRLIQAKCPDYASCPTKLDLSGATFSGAITNLNNIGAITYHNNYFTSVIFPAGTDLSGITFEGNYLYAYSANSSGEASLYVSSAQTKIPDEVTADIATIKTNGISVSGANADAIIALLVEAGVTSEKATKAYDGKATVAGGSVSAAGIGAVIPSGKTVTDVRYLTVSGGPLSPDDVTYLKGGNLTSLATLDISGTTATCDQVFDLLDNLSLSENTITLSNTQKTDLKGVNGKTFTSTDIAKAGLTINDLMDGMTTTNYFVDGTTLYVTGTLTDGDLSTISSIISSNSITTLNLSNATVTASQTLSLLENASLTTVTLGADNLATLGANANDVTFTSAMMTKMGIGTSTLLNSLKTNTNPNYIIDGTTLYVTGNIDSTVDSKIATLLSSNTSITTLDVSYATNTTAYEIASKPVIATVSLPASGNVTYAGSATQLVGGELILNITTPGDLSADITSNDALLSTVEHVKVTGALNATDIQNLYRIGAYSSVKTLNLSEATSSSWSSITGDFGNANVLLPSGTGITTLTNGNIFTVDGNALKATEIVPSTFADGADYFAASTGKTLVVTSSGNTTAAETLLAKSAITGVVSINSSTHVATVIGELNNTDLGTMNASDMSGVTRLDLSGATVASGASIDNLHIPSSLTGLVLPTAQTVSSSLATSLTTDASGLKYAYSPTSSVQNQSQEVADYVYVFVAGGLNEAMNNEPKLLTAVYVKIDGGIAINSDDANFGGHGINADASDTDYPWQYIDMSGILVTLEATLANTAPHQKSYRIILPNNHTGDHMAIFAQKPVTNDESGNGYRGNIAAVYSYQDKDSNGSYETVRLMEITDNSYRTDALNDPRIIHDGTTEVEIVSGNYYGRTYANFGNQLRIAINRAASSIETVTIKVPYDGTLLTIDNDHITTLDMSGINKAAIELNVDGCENLETLNLHGATISKASAQGITTLENVDIIKTTFETTKDTDSSSPTYGRGCINLTGSINTSPSTEIHYLSNFETDRILPSGIAEEHLKPSAKLYVEATVVANSIESNLSSATNKKNVTDGTEVTTTFGPDDVTVLHVTGTLTSADITYIVNNMTQLELLDLTGASYDTANGVDGEDVVDAFCTANKKDVVLIFPTDNTTYGEGTGTHNQHEVWYATNYTKGMKCVAYYKDDAKKDLYVYGYDETVNKLKYVMPSSVDVQFCITFEPAYIADPKSGMAGAMPANDSRLYPNATSTFVNGGLSELAANTIDLRWMNTSTVKDLSKLNANTRFVIIPTTSSNSYHESYDITKTGTDGEYKYYHFPNTVWGVATPKGTASPYSTNCFFAGRAFDFSSAGLNETALLCYMTPDGLGHINNTVGEFIFTRIGTVGRFVSAGTFDTGAIGALKFIDATEMDLVSIVIDGADDAAKMATLKSFDNDHIQYLGLPDGYNDAINATNADTFGFSGCALLKAVGAYDPSDDGDASTLPTYTVHSTDKTVTFTDGTRTAASAQENSVYKVTGICSPNASRTAGSATGLPKVVMSGYLTKADIMNNGVEAGLSGDNNLANANMKNAVFLNNEDMTYSETWQMAQLTAIVLPDDSRQTLIPKRCLQGAQITELCITHNYKKIDNAAFHNSTLNHITATDGKGALIDNGDHTFTLPGSLEQIGTKPEGTCTTIGLTPTKTLKDEETVFPHGRNITDVYVLALKTPKCYKNAFPADILYGWGGFDGTLPYCRDKYHNGTDWFSVLRYPSRESYEAASSSARQTDMEFEEDEDEPMAGVQKAPASRRATASINLSDGIDSYDEMKAAYTDVNKVYTKKEQTGAVDANGEEITWPTFSEMKRVYNQATLELTWNDWNVDYFDEGDVRQVNGGVNPVAREGGTGDINASGIGTDKIEEGSLNGDYDFTDYEGWHQFVLAQATYVEPDNATPETRNYVDAGWFTICIPYNLTIKQVREWLGVPKSGGNVKCYYGGAEVTTDEDVKMPDIRQLYSVERYESNGSDNNKVTFRLTPNLYNSGNPQVLKMDYSKTGASRIGYEDAGSGTGDDKVCLRGGTPYIIHVYKREGEVIKSYNLGKYLMTRYGDKFKETASCIHNGEPYYEYLGTAGTDVGSQIVTLKFAKPYELHQIQAFADKSGAGAEYLKYNDGNTEREYRYALVGQFWDQKLPKYCIYQSKSQWYRNSTDNNFKWAAYKCVIMAIPTITSPNVAGHMGEGFRLNGETVGTVYEGKSFYPSIESGTTDLLNGTLSIVFSDGRDDDDFNNSSSARGYAFDFDNADMSMEYDDEDGNTTTIDCLDGEDLRPSNDKVYSMTGQYMGNSLEGLSKGIYIVNGKKVYVK